MLTEEPINTSKKIMPARVRAIDYKLHIQAKSGHINRNRSYGVALDVYGKKAKDFIAALNARTPTLASLNEADPTIKTYMPCSLYVDPENTGRLYIYLFDEDNVLQCTAVASLRGEKGDMIADLVVSHVSE